MEWLGLTGICAKPHWRIKTTTITITVIIIIVIGLWAGLCVGVFCVAILA